MSASEKNVPTPVETASTGLSAGTGGAPSSRGKVSPEPFTPSSIPASSADTPTGMHLNCLVVDDNSLARTLLRGMLESLGHTVYEAETGASAIWSCKATMPDMVFLDLGLPDMDGERVLERLVDMQPDVIVIIVSGSDDMESPISSFRKGAYDYIRKNALSVDVLQQAMRNSLERHNLETALYAAEERHRKLIDNMPMVICTINEELNISFVSKASEQVMGFSPEEIVDTPGWFMNGIHPDDRLGVQEVLIEAFASPDPEPVLCEFRFLNTKKTPIFMQLRASVSKWTRARNSPGERGTASVRQLEGALIDLSERIFMERLLVQREKLNTLAALVDEIAHEFRNPVFALASFARILQRKYPEASEADMLLEEARRLETMINRIQEYLTPVEVVWEECNLEEVVRFATGIIRPLLARRNVEIDANIDPLPSIESNNELLAQIVVGMLTLAEQWADNASTVEIRAKNLLKGLVLNISMDAPDIAGNNPEMPITPISDSGNSQPLALGYKLARALGCLLSLRHEGGQLIATLLIPLTRSEQEHAHDNDAPRPASKRIWESEAFLMDTGLTGKNSVQRDARKTDKTRH